MLTNSSKLPHPTDSTESGGLAARMAIFHARGLTRIFIGCMITLLGAAEFWKLISYRSSEPWIFGIYSLPYFLFMVFAISGLSFVAFLFYRFHLKAFYLLIGLFIGSIFVGGLALVLAEAAGQLYAFMYPAYRVLAFQPDRNVGWKLVPGLRFTWAGHYWYAREFSVPIQINSYGFRDVEHAIQKPANVSRIALLGDSMVEAFQVPFEKTAAHRLEQILNSSDSRNANATPYEVLNFGVSNYGVGQYLLTWEQYASRFKPDYVFILVGEIHMDRTVTAYEPSALSATPRRLWVRPIFRLNDRNTLVREPARDFDEFVNVQHDVIEHEMGGSRIARRSHEIFLRPFFQTSLWNRLMTLQRSLTGSAASAKPREVEKPLNAREQATIAVNLKVIEELGRKANASGARFVVVDASRYFAGLKWSSLSPALKALCAEHGFGWIPLGEELLAAEKNGVQTRWPYDQHFNETGNQMFADAMRRWMIAN